MNLPYSRFATTTEVQTAAFRCLNQELNRLNLAYALADYSETNAERFPWSDGMLGTPAFYAARLWEYPFALSAAELTPGMTVADVGCGMTPFTVYLQECAGCEVTGVDPDRFEYGFKCGAFGVSQEFLTRTGLRVLRGDMRALPLESDSQDRVFCLSVMEHVPPPVARLGMQEFARVLRPGGRAIVTLDLSMWLELNRPLDLVWDSGLMLLPPIDLRWPPTRFGRLERHGRAADVLGLTLVKDDTPIATEYSDDGHPVATLPAFRIPTLIPRREYPPPPLWQRVARRIRRHLRRSGARP